MGIIRNENKKALFYSSIFLILTGVFVFLYSYFLNYNTGAFLGSAFAILSLICLGFIINDFLFTAKLLWGTCTPLLIIISPVFFSVERSSTILSFGYALIGASLFVIYSFHEQREKWGMWVCILIFFISIFFYDKIIMGNSESGLDYTFVTNNYLHFKITQVFHFFSLVYLILLVKKSKENIERKLADRIIRFKQFTENLLSVSKNKNVHSGIIKESLKEIVLFAANNLDVSRVSVWEYDDEIHALKCLVCFDGIEQKFIAENILYDKDFPIYFTYLLSEKMIIADNAMEDLKTREFKDFYLIPNSIKSMMDYPFFIDGKFKGILCCEEQRAEKNGMKSIFFLLRLLQCI